MIRRFAGQVVVAAVVIVAAAGCSGASNPVSADRQHEQRMMSESAGYSVHVRCQGASCALAVRSRLHSQREAILIGWPILVGWASDPSLSAVKHVALTLSDAGSGAQLRLSCDRARAQAIPIVQTSVPAVRRGCATSWRGRY